MYEARNKISHILVMNVNTEKSALSQWMTCTSTFPPLQNVDLILTYLVALYKFIPGSGFFHRKSTASVPVASFILKPSIKAHPPIFLIANIVELRMQFAIKPCINQCQCQNCFFFIKLSSIFFQPNLSRHNGWPIDDFPSNNPQCLIAAMYVGF